MNVNATFWKNPAPHKTEIDGMQKKFQAKNIDTLPILEYLKERPGEWCCWADPAEVKCAAGRSIREATPPGMPEKVVLAKMRSLIRRGLVSGCDCGCRGDFELTAKGEEWIARSKEGKGDSI